MALLLGGTCWSSLNIPFSTRPLRCRAFDPVHDRILAAHPGQVGAPRFDAVGPPFSLNRFFLKRGKVAFAGFMDLFKRYFLRWWARTLCP